MHGQQNIKKSAGCTYDFRTILAKRVRFFPTQNQPTGLSKG